MFFLDLQTLQSGDEGWLALDVTAASDRWLLNRNKDLGLRLYVETDDGKTRVSSEPSPGGSSEEAAGGRHSSSPSRGPGGLAVSTCAAGGYLHPYAGAQCIESEVSAVQDSRRPPTSRESLLSFCRTNSCVAQSESTFSLPKKWEILSTLRSCLLHREFPSWAGGGGGGKRSHPQALRQRPGCESQLCSLLTR